MIKTGDFGEFLRDWREKKVKLTLDQLAEKSGVSASALSLYERSKRQINIDTIDKIAASVGVAPDELLLAYLRTRYPKSKLIPRDTTEG